jgi:aspartate oxidase
MFKYCLPLKLFTSTLINSELKDGKIYLDENKNETERIKDAVAVLHALLKSVKLDVIDSTIDVCPFVHLLELLTFIGF